MQRYKRWRWGKPLSYHWEGKLYFQSENGKCPNGYKHFLLSGILATWIILDMLSWSFLSVVTPVKSLDGSEGFSPPKSRVWSSPPALSHHCYWIQKEGGWNASRADPALDCKLLLSHGWKIAQCTLAWGHQPFRNFNKERDKLERRKGTLKEKIATWK